MLEDRVLVWKFRRGSREALGCIYEKYESYLLTVAVNLLGDGGLAEDVVQDVFVGFVRSIGKFSLRGSLKGYLAICVANRARDLMRRAKRQRTVAVNEAEQMQSYADGPVQLVIRSEELQRVRLAAKELAYEQREVIVLRLHGDLRFRQIAELQEVSVKTVLSRYRYGLDKLRSLLDGEVKK